jgi:hypothetical protein
METAESAARALGIRLTATHWQVLGCAREECLRTRSRPDAGLLARRTGLAPEEIGRLFPGDASALIATLAGLDRDACGESR